MLACHRRGLPTALACSEATQRKYSPLRPRLALFPLQREGNAKRLASVTAQIDNRLTYASKPMRNVKKEMIAEERYARIEKDNLLLLQRMHAVRAHLSAVAPQTRSFPYPVAPPLADPT